VKPQNIGSRPMTVPEALDATARLIEEQGHTFDEYDMNLRERGPLGLQAGVEVAVTGRILNVVLNAVRNTPARLWSLADDRALELVHASLLALELAAPGGSLDAFEYDVEHEVEVVEFLRHVAQHEREAAEESAALAAVAVANESAARARWAVAS